MPVSHLHPFNVPGLNEQVCINNQIWIVVILLEADCRPTDRIFFNLANTKTLRKWSSVYAFNSDK